MALLARWQNMAEMARSGSFHHTMSASGEPLAASPDDLDDAADGLPLRYWSSPMLLSITS